MAQVHRLTVYPIKSLDGVSLERANISKGGALAWDRQWAIADRKGRWISGKRTPAVFRLRANFDLDKLRVQFSADEYDSPWLGLESDVAEIEAWLSDYFQQPVKLERNSDSGFPDDSDAFGPTLISTATLETVQTWFPDLSLDNLRARFRANIEVDQVPAFWEDQLYRVDEIDSRFQIGAVSFIGSNPCQRCGVPMRDPLSGAVYPDFHDRFVAAREKSLPAWADRRSFDHFYRLSINTRVPRTQAGQQITIGDALEFSPPDPGSGYRGP